MKKVNINLKLQLITSTVVIFIAVSLVIISIFSLNNLLKENIKTYKEDIIKSKIIYIKDATKFTTSIIESYYNNIDIYIKKFLEKEINSLLSILHSSYLTLQKEGYSKDEIKKIFKDIIIKVRYGKNGYFWINDTACNMVIHPIKPSLNGKNLSNVKDLNGVYLFKKFVSTAKNGGGIVRYYWPKPGSNKPVAKMSYVKLFKPFDWIIGTGVYVDEVEDKIKKEALQKISKIRYGEFNKNYFWINDMNYNIIMHPIKKELVGKNFKYDPKIKFVSLAVDALKNLQKMKQLLNILFIILL